MIKTVLFVVNPKSGKANIKNTILNIVDLFSKNGFMTTVYTTQKRKDATEIVKEYGEKYDIIVCAGGDGTLDEVVAGIQEAGLDKPIGYIPSGSTNDFAISMGIPFDNLEAADLVVNGSIFKCDVGCFNDSIFTYIAAFGAFTEVSYSTPQQTKNILGHLAYLLEGVKSLSSITSYKVRVEYDDVVIEDDIIFGMVTNSLSIGGMKRFRNEDVDFDDGLFEVVLIKQPKNPLELQATLAALLKDDVDNEYMYYAKVSSLKISSEEKIPWTLDGEFGGDHNDVLVENNRQSMCIYRPKNCIVNY